MGKIILESKKLSKSYSNGNKQLEVIKNLNLKVNTAEIITIVGNSGSGKSTLLNLLGGLDSPDSGDLNILGKDILRQKFEERVDQGIKNWKHLRPWKAFTPKMLATGPTPAAGLGTALWAGSLIGDYMKKNVPVSNFVSGRNAGRSAFKQLKIKKKNE